MARKVVDPRGEEWKVGRQWAPWRPRLRDPDSSDASSLGDVLDLSDAGSLLLGLILAFVVVVAFLVLWPLVALAIELTIVVLGVLVATAGRVLLRRPWVVRAWSARGRERRWSVVGWRASGELIDAIASSLAGGLALPPEGEGHRLPS